MFGGWGSKKKMEAEAASSGNTSPTISGPVLTASTSGMVRTVTGRSDALSDSRGDVRSPQQHIADLDRSGHKSTVSLLSMKVELTSASDEWIEGFFAADGLGAIEAALFNNVDDIGVLSASINLAAEAVNAAARSERGLDVVVDVPTFVQALVLAYSRSIMTSVSLSHPSENVHGVPMPSSNIPLATIALEKDRLNIRKTCLMILTVIANHSDDGLGIVVESLENVEADLHVSKQFGLLVEDLAMELHPTCSVHIAEHWAAKAGAMALIQLLVSKTPTLSIRSGLRGLLSLAGLLTTLSSLEERMRVIESTRASASDTTATAVRQHIDDLRHSMDSYRAEKDEDDEEAVETGAGTLLTDPEVLVSGILSNAATTGNYFDAMEILQCLTGFSSLANTDMAGSQRTVSTFWQQLKEKLVFLTLDRDGSALDSMDAFERVAGGLRMKAHIEDLELQVRNLHSRHASLQSSHSDGSPVSFDRAKLTASVEALQAELATARASQKEAEAYRGVAAESMRSVESALAECEAKLAMEQSRRSTLEAEVDRLKGMVRRIEGEMAAAAEAKAAAPTPTAATTPLMALSGGAPRPTGPPSAVPSPMAGPSAGPRPARPAGGPAAEPSPSAGPRPARPAGGPPSAVPSPAAGPRPARPGPGSATATAPSPVAARPGRPPSYSPSPPIRPAQLPPSVEPVPTPGGAAGMPALVGPRAPRPAAGGAGLPPTAPGPGIGGGAPARPASALDAMLSARPGRPMGRPSGAPTGATPAPGGATAAPQAAPAPAPASKPVKAVPKASCKLKGLFWTKIPDSAVDNTLFKEISDAGIVVDTAEIERMFRAAAAAQPAGPATSPTSPSSNPDATSSKARGPVLLLDSKRQQNAGITLARVRLPPADIRMAILGGNVNVLKLEQISRLCDVIPTPEEIQLVRDYEGDRSALGSVEQYFLTVYDIPRYEGRLQTMAFVLRAEQIVADIVAKLEALGKGVTAIRSSPALRSVLQHVLAVGNFLNGDSAVRGSAYGFKLDTLKKLVTVKSVDNKANLVDVLARMAVDGTGKAADMKALAVELRPVSQAKMESLDAVVSECKSVQRSLQQAEALCTQLAAAAKLEGDTFAKALSPLLLQTAAAVRTMSDHETAVTSAFKELLLAYMEDTCDTIPIFTMFSDFVGEFNKSLEGEVARRLKDAKRPESIPTPKPVASPASAAGAPAHKPGPKPNLLSAMYSTIRAGVARPASGSHRGKASFEALLEPLSAAGMEGLPDVYVSPKLLQALAALPADSGAGRRSAKGTIGRALRMHNPKLSPDLSPNPKAPRVARPPSHMETYKGGFVPPKPAT